MIFKPAMALGYLHLYRCPRRWDAHTAAPGSRLPGYSVLGVTGRDQPGGTVVGDSVRQDVS